MEKHSGIQLKKNSWNREQFRGAKWTACLIILLTMSVGMFAQSSNGNALSIDGVDDFAYPLSPNASGLSEGSVELWFSTNAWSGSEQLWGGGNGLPGVTGDWTRFGTHSSVGGSNLAFGIYSGVWRWASTGTQPASETWYHVAATWGPSGMKIYLNGTLAGQNSFTGGVHNYTTELVSTSAWGFSFAGDIDELRIWNIARDSLAIVSTLNDTLGPVFYTTSDSGLIAYYRMDGFEDLGINSDGTDDLRDLSLNSNHLDTDGNPILEPSGAFRVKGIRDKSVGTPHNIKLNQNYPNPFNPSTTIKFNLPQTEYVELSVYSALGKEVTTLVSGKLSQGNHSYQFDASNLASGVYLYRLSTDQGYTQTKKFVLIK